MKITESTLDRLVIVADSWRQGYYGFDRLSIAWLFCPFLVAEICIQLSPNDYKFWIAGISIIVTGVISFTLWFWKLEIELTKEAMRIRERLLWRKNSDENISFHRLKEALVRSRWPYCQLVVALLPSGERVLASGIFSEHFQHAKIALNAFMRSHRAG
jgi:hypothetical protein